MKSTKIKPYYIIRKVIPKQMAEFLKDYLIMKSQVYNHYREDRVISPYNKLFGEHEDTQVSGSYCTYGDIAMDTLLVRLKNKIEKCVKKN